MVCFFFQLNPGKIALETSYLFTERDLRPKWEENKKKDVIYCHVYVSSQSECIFHPCTPTLAWLPFRLSLICHFRRFLRSHIHLFISWKVSSTKTASDVVNAQWRRCPWEFDHSYHFHFGIEAKLHGPTLPCQRWEWSDWLSHLFWCESFYFLLIKAHLTAAAS